MKRKQWSSSNKQLQRYSIPPNNEVMIIIIIMIIIMIIIIIIIIIIITIIIKAKKGEDYATTVSWIRSKVSFAILRSALICLRGSRTVKRNRNTDIYAMDFQVENSRTAI